LPEERNLDWLANLDPLALLHENLARVLAAIFAVKRRDTVLFGVVALLEWLERGHEVMPTRNTVCDNSLCDTGRDGSLDDSGNGVHGTDNL